MTNKELERIWRVILLLTGFIFGLAIGGLITSLRYDSEIRTDQLELKEQVAEIIEDKQVIQDLTTELSSQIEQIKAERKALDELRRLMSEGEGK